MATRSEAQRRQFALFGLLHAVLFLGLYQMGFTPAEWSEIEREAQTQHVSKEGWVYRTHGAFGLVRAYYRTDSDERLYREYANLALDGSADTEYIAKKQYAGHTPVHAGRLVPYRDVRIEYPPFALLVGMIPPRLISGDSYFDYRIALGGWLWCIQLLNLHCALLLVRRWPYCDLRDERRVLVGSLWFSVLLGNIVATRIDALVATFILLVVHLIERAERSSNGDARRLSWLSGVAMALGAMTKIVPALLMLPVWIALWLGRSTDRVRRMGAVLLGFSLTFGAIHLGCLAVLGRGYLATYTYHASRGIQLESIVGSAVLLARWWGHHVALDLSYGSSNVVSSVTPLLSRLAPWLFAGGATIYGSLALSVRKSNVLRGAIAVLILFIATNKVFSPQYLIWLALPLLVLSVREKRRTFEVCLFLLAGLSQVLYPRAYPLLKSFSTPLVLVLVLRNGCLLALLVLLWRRRAAQAPLASIGAIYASATKMLRQRHRAGTPS